MQKEELNRIIEQIESFCNHNWTGLDLDQILNEINDEIANTEIPLFTNTIHQFARHLIADDFLVMKRLQGIDYELSKDEDWISSDKLKEIKWSDTIQAIKKGKADLIGALKDISDDDLDNPILNDQASIYVTLHGNIQHSYYHMGQISQMKKAIENLNKSS